MNRLVSTNSHNYGFITNHYSIYSKLDTKQHISTQYRIITNGQIPKLRRKLPQYWYYANNFSFEPFDNTK